MSHAAALQYQCLSQLVPPSAFPVLSTSGPYIRASAAVTVQPLSHVQLSVTPWTAARQASLSFTVSRSLLKLMPIESVMPSNRPILCRPLLLLPSIFPSIRVFSNELALHVRWPKYSCPANRFISTIFAHSIHTCINIQYLFISF